jgi:hypothetical protein
MIHLCIEPATAPMSWKAFTRQYPPKSIALDGFVSDKPRFNPRGPWANFNHHEGVSRLETRATCCQVLLATRMGRFSSFCDDEGHPQASLYVNDCDEDVCLSVFILQNRNLVVSVTNPILNRLVFMEDMLDTTAGMYPFPVDMPALEEVMWVFDPYRQFRLSGEIDKRVTSSFYAMVELVNTRIMAHLTGRGKRIALNPRYELLAKENGWSMVREIGNGARFKMHEDGIQAFVSLRERPDGSFGYVIGRSDPYVSLPLPKIVKAVNKAEGLLESDDRWGGGDTSVGSPRISGSKLDPVELTRIIKSVCK